MKEKCITIETVGDGSIFILEEGSSGCTFKNITCRKELLKAFESYLYEQSDIFEPEDEEGRSLFNKDKAEKILSNLHILPSEKAYFYLRDAACMAKEDCICISNVGKQIIPELAQRYEVSTISIDQAMRRAINKCYNSGMMKKAYRFTALYETLGRGPRVREFLAEMVKIMDDMR